MEQTKTLNGGAIDNRPQVHNLPHKAIAILGGGPAGVATALSLHQLAPSWKITIVHIPQTAPWRPGETLAPGARPILESLGLWQPFLADGHLESAGTRAAWGSPEPYDHEFLFSTLGPGWDLDRPRFDAMLLECARAAGVHLTEGRATISSADFVVDATGRAARFAASRGARTQTLDDLVGAGCIFSFRELPPDTRTLIEACEDGWWYSAALPDGRAVAAWMSDADLVRRDRLHDPGRWCDRLAAAPLTSARFETAEVVTAPSIFSARSQQLMPCAGPGWLAAGDAASAFDPLSSQGILRALRMGKIASFTVFDHLQGRADALERYRQYIAAEFQHYSTSRGRYYSLEVRWPGAPFWARRQADSNAAGITHHGQRNQEHLPAI